jgi:hypothetical protein
MQQAPLVGPSTFVHPQRQQYFGSDVSSLRDTESEITWLGRIKARAGSNGAPYGAAAAASGAARAAGGAATEEAGGAAGGSGDPPPQGSNPPPDHRNNNHNGNHPCIS